MAINYADPFGRKFRSLRISLTQACNFSCTYCVPENFKLQAEKDELNPDQFYRLTRYLIETAGVEKIRLTGGEPLIYRHFDKFITLLSQLPVEDISLTTNAAVLQKKIPILLKSGFKRLNISLDSIEANTFAHMSRTGKIKKTLEGIEAALQAKIKLKVNMVPMRTFNYKEILPLLEYCLERGIECRYIELMKMGHVSQIFQENFVSMDEILNIIGTKYKIEKAMAPADSTSQRYQIQGKGVFGIIPNESEPFCKSCSRLRICSTGKLYGCLSNTTNHSIRYLLDLPEAKAKDELIQILKQSMQSKQIQFQGAETYMQVIGG